MPSPRRRFLELPWRSRAVIARDVDDELRFHFDSRITDLVAAGVDPEAARERAVTEFGDVERTRAYCRRVDARVDRGLRAADRADEFLHDARYALRTLARSPGFALVSLLTLALAIGANTAVFSVERAVLLAPLPFAAPSRLFRLYSADAKDPASIYPFSPADFADVSDQQTTFAGLAAMETGTSTWAPSAGDPQLVSAPSVSTSLFHVLGVAPRYGRTFAPGDDVPGNDAKAVLSDAFWRRAFGGDSSVVGRSIVLNGASVTVIGVMPRGFTIGWNEDVFLPLGLADALSDRVRARKQHYVHVIGRLAPGVSVVRATADLQTIARRLSAANPESDADRTITAVSLHDVMIGDVRPALLLLQAAAVIVLLIACANLANLTLTRATSRRREIALRAALGAGRGRLVRQMLAESVLLACVGGLLGVGLAAVATRTLLALNPDALPTMFGVSLNAPVLLFSAAVSVLTGVAFGLVPALGAARADLHESLKEGGRGASNARSGERMRRTLSVAQIALAMMLLVGGGLLLRSFTALIHAPIGFDPNHVLTAEFRAAGERYDSASAVNGFYDAVLRNVAAAPGVVAAGAATVLPTRGNVFSTLRIVGEPVDEAHLPDLGYVSVRGEYLRAMGMRLLAGRDFSAVDTPNGPPVALLNETAARRYFPNGRAVGRQVRIGPDPHSTPITIVGVIGDIRDASLGTPSRPTLFADHAQQTWDRSLSLVVRTAGDPHLAAEAVRRAVRAADRSVAIRNVQTLDDVLGRSLAPRRFSLGLVTAFAVIALMLAVIGVYGVLAYAVSTRTREFGVRLALGATARNVSMLVVRQGVSWSLVGLALGVVGAAIEGRLLRGMLYGVTPLDPSTFVAVAVGLFAVVCAACVVPALRAMRVDPMTSMRAE